jgi:hypothetical protein
MSLLLVQGAGNPTINGSIASVSSGGRVDIADVEREIGSIASTSSRPFATIVAKETIVATIVATSSRARADAIDVEREIGSIASTSSRARADASILEKITGVIISTSSRGFVTAVDVERENATIVSTSSRARADVAAVEKILATIASISSRARLDISEVEREVGTISSVSSAPVVRINAGTPPNVATIASVGSRGRADASDVEREIGFIVATSSGARLDVLAIELQHLNADITVTGSRGFASLTDFVPVPSTFPGHIDLFRLLEIAHAQRTSTRYRRGVTIIEAEIEAVGSVGRAELDASLTYARTSNVVKRLQRAHPRIVGRIRTRGGVGTSDGSLTETFVGSLESVSSSGETDIDVTELLNSEISVTASRPRVRAHTETWEDITDENLLIFATGDWKDDDEILAIATLLGV